MAPPLLVTPPLPLPNVWLGAWSRPPDRPSHVILACSALLLVIALVPGGPEWLVGSFEVAGARELRRSRRFLFVAAFAAAFLSLGYIALYLRGGPRAPESATYWLQGRALLRGHLAWTALDPTASFRAKNLVFSAPDRLAGIFPPGYALLLAPAFLLGAPMLVGPLLAAAIVPITWLLGRELAARATDDPARIESVGRIAVLLSVVSAGLRYHTAESLPHGAAAAALAAALASALYARRVGEARLFAGAGLALGFLIATQPASGVPAGIVVLAVVLGAGERARALAWTCAAAVPGVALLLAANHAAIGHALASPAAFYARFVYAEPAPAGARAQVLAVLRIVRAHLTDVDNFEPILLVPLLLLRARGGRGAGAAAGLAALAIAVQLVFVAATAGHQTASAAAGIRGALAHVLPLEHALVALALVIAIPARMTGAATAATVAFAMAGFALHVAPEHERLAAAGWGRPHFEPVVAREAGATHGLLFFDDDEGYELAHAPGVLSSHGLEAVRMRGDDHDRLLYDLLGHPPTHRYVFTQGAASVSSWTPNGSDTWRFEAEADWPLVAPSGLANARVEILDASGTCASDSRALGLTALGPGDVSVTLELPIPRAATGTPKQTWNVTPRAYHTAGVGLAALTLVATLGGPALAEWTWSDGPSGAPTCTELPTRTFDLAADQTRAWLVLSARGGPVALDRTTLRAR